MRLKYHVVYGIAVIGLVTALGGEISFQSEPAAGTTFRVVLPTTARPT